MAEKMSRQEAVGRLRGALAARAPNLEQMIKAKQTVLGRYQPVFRLENLPKLTQEEFRGFLVFRNNQHWVGLHRKWPEICADMPKLRAALALLLDESRPIEKRMDDLAPGRPAAIPNVGRAILTAVLLIAHPDKYGVWNNRSQGSMEMLGLWPEFDRGASFGRRYAKVNDLLLELAQELGTDLWTLDGLWWAVSGDAEEAPQEAADAAQPSPPGADEGGQLFGLERHLHDFLSDNWKDTSLGKDWDLHTEDGEVVGYEYPTPVGRIDLLAKHKRESRWLVVELKRDQSSDSTVGQALRYMGYVREHVAGKGDTVEGMIIAHAGDDRIRYALEVTPDLSLMLYEVDFRLRAAKQPK